MRSRSTLLRSQNWSFVILQAQKYSTSGQFAYSTEEAKELIRMSRAQHAVPVMFPEWPRRNVDETQRIYDLHVSIAQAEPACVAPIGQAWDLALARDPTLTLHALGRQSLRAGRRIPRGARAVRDDHGIVAARSAELSRNIRSTQSLQETLRGIAAETVQTVPPRMWCPGGSDLSSYSCITTRST